MRFRPLITFIPKLRRLRALLKGCSIGGITSAVGRRGWTRRLLSKNGVQSPRKKSANIKKRLLEMILVVALTA